MLADVAVCRRRDDEVNNNFIKSISLPQLTIEHSWSFSSLLLIAVYAVSTLNAKDAECNFKKIILETKSETHVTCEFNNVKYDGRDNFNIIANHSVLQNISGINPEDEYVDEDRIDDFVTQINFKSSKVSSIPNTIFRKFSQLQVFDGSSVDLHNINSLSLNGAENLQMIFLYSNRLTTVNDYCFVHSKNLKILDLSSNKISQIQAFAFNSLNNLEELSLSNNQIKSIDDATFQPLTQLKWIWLDRNQISVVSSDLFSKTNENLFGIYLNNNDISIISPYVFDHLKQLRFLMLIGNKCINRDFKHFVIQENASIKMEMRECFLEYQKIHRPEDDKHNITVKLNALDIANRRCINATFDTLESLSRVQSEISKLVVNSEK